MAKRKKRNRGGGVPFNPDVDTGTKRPVTARVAVGDVNDKFSDYPSNGLTPRRLEDMMALTRGEMNTLYRDSIIQVLSTKIDNYRKTDILQPSDDMVLEQDKVIMAGDINVTVRNVVQSARGKE